MDNIDQNKIDITEIDLVDLDEMPEDTTPEQTEAEDFSDDFDHAEIDAPEVDLNDVDIDLDIPDVTLDSPEVDVVDLDLDISDLDLPEDTQNPSDLDDIDVPDVVLSEPEVDMDVTLADLADLDVFDSAGDSEEDIDLDVMVFDEKPDQIQTAGAQEKPQPVEEKFDEADAPDETPDCHSEQSEESTGKETDTTEDEATVTVISSEVERSPNAEQTETSEDAPTEEKTEEETAEDPVAEEETPDCHSEQSEESPGKETETSEDEATGTVISSEVERSPNAEQNETTEDAPTEEEGSDEKAIPEEDLEAYRDIQAVTADSEMVDLTGFKARSRAKDEKEAAKKKKSKKPAFDLFAHRTKNKSINARIAAAEPILYFYNAVLDKKGSVLFINVYQVLQDRFMGKVVPHQYTAVAEGSGRIEELNTICVQEVVKQCNQFPDYKFAVQISSRFFTKPNVLEKLVNQAQTENNNLIFAFDAISLQNIGIAAKTGLAMLKNRGISVLLDNAELISMNLLTELDYDIIRVDSRYYEREGEKTYSYLQFLIKFAHEIGITTCATFCDEDKIADYMLENGIDGVQGCAVSNPVRTVPNTIKAITLLDSMVNYHEEDLDFYHQQELAQTAEIGATSGRR